MIILRFQVDIKSNKCFDINYDPVYLNRYTDSLSLLNSLKIDLNNDSLEINFNLLKTYSNDLTFEIIEYIHNNVSLNDECLAKLILILLSKQNHMLFNENILFFRNIRGLHYNKTNLKNFEDYISNNFDYPNIIIYSNIDLRHLNYEEIYCNYYMKKLY